MKNNSFYSFTGKYLFVTAICLFISVRFVYSQASVSADIQSMVTPSPNAASLGKYIDIPVGYYTGIPEVSIPLFTVKDGDVQIPLSLSYHTGGIKVDEMSSWTGLGWSLNAGGSITRSTRGLPDNIDQFMKFDADKIYKYTHSQLTAQETKDYIYSIYKGGSDGEADIYNVSVNNESYKFSIDNTGKFVTFPRSSNIKILYNSEGFDWIIVNGQGMRYKFRDHDTNETSYFSSSGTESTDGGYNNSISTWYLSEAEDVKGNKVTFNYANQHLNFQNSGTQTMQIVSQDSYVNSGGKCANRYTRNYSVSSIDAKRLKSINFTSGKIVFDTNPSNRLDVPGDSILRYIKIYNSNNELKKTYELFTSYFVGNQIGTSNQNLTGDEYKYRLRLDSLKEESQNNSLKPYVFNYIANNLPYRNSYAQDHWGYYNGIDNNTAVSYKVNDVLQGASKRVDPLSTEASTLQSITYPTGGNIEFEYEGNKFLTNDISYTDQSLSEAQLAGVSGNNNNTDTFFTFESNFSVTADQLTDGTLKVRVEATKDGYSSGCSCNMDLFIIKPNGSQQNIVGGQVVYLTAGNYKIRAEITSEFPGKPYLFLAGYLKYQPLPPKGNDNLYEVNGPGVRIHKITKHFSNNSTAVQLYDYQLTNGASSGLIGNLPNYDHNVLNRIPRTNNENEVNTFDCNCIVYTSVSNYPLVNTRGSYVGYNHVTEYFDTDKGNGTKTYTYTNYNDFPDINSTTPFPFIPNSPVDWKRGLVLKESTFKKVNNTLSLLQSKGSVYQVSSDTTRRQFNGIKVGANTYYSFPISTDLEYSTLSSQSYPVYSDAIYSISDTTITYDTPTGIEKINNYDVSEDNFQVKQISMVSSDKSTQIKKIYYPGDYAVNRLQSPVLDAMLGLNVVNIPIEEISYVIRNGATKLSSATLNLFDLNPDPENGKKQLVLKKIFDSDLTDLQSSAVYDFINIPSRYTQKAEYSSFNTNGMPGMLTQRAIQNTSFLWSSKSHDLVAEVKNAKTNDIFYDSFEEGNGNSTLKDSKTGNYSYSGLYSKSLGQLDAGRYLLTYWQKSGSIWLFVKTPVTITGNAYTININAQIDDVRLHPENALMTTYTFDPLIGMTSMTDAKGQATYYEYDSFMRLKNVRDDTGNIIKHTDYHYQNQ